MQCAEQEGGRRMRRFFLKKIAVLAVLLAAVLAAFPAFAEVDITPTSDFYVYDGADVLSETTETVPLPAFSTTILIGKLQKGDAVISFKIGEIGK